MQVKLVRSGGFAGLDMVATVDSVDLPADHQDLVTSLLAGDLPEEGGSRSGGADQFSYELDIRHGDRMVRRHWDEPDVPDSVRPLLAALTRQARPVR